MDDPIQDLLPSPSAPLQTPICQSTSGQTPTLLSTMRNCDFLLKEAEEVTSSANNNITQDATSLPLPLFLRRYTKEGVNL